MCAHASREAGKVAEGRMGCGKQVWFREDSRRRSRNPTWAEAVGRTPSGALRHLPQQAGEGVGRESASVGEDAIARVEIAKKAPVGA